MSPEPPQSPTPDPVQPSPDEALFELLLDQLERIDDEEEERRKTADGKLTTAISVTPLIVALATSGMFELLQNVERLAGLKWLVLPLYIAAITFLLVGVGLALRAYSPGRAQYSRSAASSIARYAKGGTRQELLREMIDDRGQAIPLNVEINSNKLGDYMAAARLTFIGVCCIAAAVAIVCIGALFGVLNTGATTASSGVGHAAPTATPTP